MTDQEKEQEKANKLAAKAQEESAAAEKAAKEAEEKKQAAAIAAVNASADKTEQVEPPIIPVDEKFIIKQPTEYVEISGGGKEQKNVEVKENKKTGERKTVEAK